VNKKRMTNNMPMDLVLQGSGLINQHEFSDAMGLFMQYPEDPIAQYFIGHILQSDKKSVEDYEQAMEWLLRSAAGGCEFSHVRLGYAYSNGLGVPKDDLEAIKWYSIPANRGDSIAQLNLGLLYADSHQVELNLIEACKWFALSSDMGCEEAKHNFHVAVNRMTDADSDESIKLAGAWLGAKAEQAVAGAKVDHHSDLAKRIMRLREEAGMVGFDQMQNHPN
jgi:TPR repeat protein